MVVDACFQSTGGPGRVVRCFPHLRLRRTTLIFDAKPRLNQASHLPLGQTVNTRTTALNSNLRRGMLDFGGVQHAGLHKAAPNDLWMQREVALLFVGKKLYGRRYSSRDKPNHGVRLVNVAQVNLVAARSTERP